MNIKNYIVTIGTVIMLAPVTYMVAILFGEVTAKLYITTYGVLNMVAFFAYMIYNAESGDMSKPKRVISGWKMVENADKHRFNYGKSTGSDFVDGAGFGFNLPNVAGFAIGILLLVIGNLL